ncbi:protein kish-a [Quercus suber]|uniref:Protein kish-a n=1 Tax=Quercus suber TaxID=58331 RepID=A0AAW0K218_QUESU
MSALFNFHSFLTVVLLVICTCTFLKMQFPTFLEQKTGFRGFFWKAARIEKFRVSDIPGQPFNIRCCSLACIRWSNCPVDDLCDLLKTGERLSPWVAAGCFTMGVSIIFF